MIVGLCTYSIEDFRKIIDAEKEKKVYTKDFDEFMTVAEFQASDFSKNTRIILVDNIAKLLSIQDLPILDAEYYNGSWRMKRDYIKQNLWYLLSLPETWYKGPINYQFQIVWDFNLGEYSFITHLNEYNKSQYQLVKKIHNILSKTKKEQIDCSEYYKNILKEKLINKKMSDLYLEFLDKKKQEYPEIFKYIKFTIESDYGEKDRKEAEKAQKKLEGE